MASIVLFLPLITAALILLVLKKNSALSAIVSVASALVCLVISMLMLGSKEVAGFAYRWIELGSFKLEISSRMGEGGMIDSLAKSMLFVVTFIGALVHVFSLGYMKEDEGKARFFAGLSLFMFSMTGIVLSANFAMMFIFWELVGVSSYILIGHWYEKASASDAAKKAFLSNRIGDFGFMIGILLLFSATGSTDFAVIERAAPGLSAGLLTVATLCIFCGAIGKSAQFPLHVWLPDAMEGPTPVSALIHAATMVAAGVYMMVRVAFLVAASATAAYWISWIGGLTALMAALMATQQNDIKRILAYSTLSQLGYMVMSVGLGAMHHEGGHGLLGFQAGYFHLFTHAFFKALLFLGSGAIIFACHHEQDIWKMGGLKDKMKLTALTFVVGTAALIAVPLTSGYFSKEAILNVAWENNKVLFLIAGGTAFLTAFYMTRLLVVVFLGKPRDHGAEHAHEVGPTMLVPLLLLGVPSLLAGFPALAGMVLPAEFVPPLNFSPGHVFNAAGLMSLIALGAGVFLAFTVYRGKDKDPIRIPLFANKFYFDELYQKIVSIFQDALAVVVSLVDKIFIDVLAVTGISRGAGGLGQILRRLQVGNLQGYTFLFGAGVLVVLFLALSRA